MSWPFVARIDEQERFAAILTRASRATPDEAPSDVLLVEGLGGFGKSELLKRFADIALGVAENPLGSLPPFLVVSVDWQVQRERRPAAFSMATGLRLSTVLTTLHGAILDEARSPRNRGLLPRATPSGRKAETEVGRAFGEFTTLLARVPELAAIAERAKQEADAGPAAAARQIGAAAAVAGEIGTAAAPTRGAIVAPIGELAATRRRGRGQPAHARNVDEWMRIEEGLARTFALGVRSLSRTRPVVLLLDTYEIVSTVGPWLREAARQTGERAFWVLAGRLEPERAAGESSEVAAFRREVTEGRLRVISMTAFGDATVKDLLQRALGLQAPDPQVEAAVLSVTRGIPFGVRLVAQMLADGRDVADVLRPVTEHGDGSEVVRQLAERYLKHVREDEGLKSDAARLYGLALLYADRADPDVLGALWNEARPAGEILDDLVRRHDFVLTSTKRLHQEVRDTVRDYLLDSVRRSEVRAANRRAAEVIRARLDAVPIAGVEDLLGSEAWRADVLALLWHRFWISNDEGIALLSELLPAAVLLRPSFAHDVVAVAQFFLATFSAEHASLLRGYVTMLSFGSFIDSWLARRRTSPSTLRSAGPFARLRDSASSEDRDSALAYLTRTSRNAPTVLAPSPPQSAICALLWAACVDPDDVTVLDRLEDAAPSLPPHGPFADAAIRVASRLRDAFRGAAAETADPVTCARAAKVDARFTADARHAGSLGAYAVFLRRVLGDHEHAQEMYERAIAADPDHASNLGNYAVFLETVRRDVDQAQALYERAIAADPRHANNVSNYASFLRQFRGEVDRAQELFEQAIAANPNHARSLSKYAVFLTESRGDLDRAQELFERAIAASPNHANCLGAYAVFLKNARGDYDRAQELYERAIAADPSQHHNFLNYAILLKSIRGEMDRAEEVYEQAVAAAPTQPDSLGNYALFLDDVRADRARAKEMYQRALAAGPDDANNLGNYARLLLESGADAAALPMIRRALELATADQDPLRAELWFYLFGVGPPDGRRQALQELALLIADGVRSPGWDFSRIVARARAEQHRDQEWLPRLADVISEEAPAHVLDAWEDWPTGSTDG
jgi:Tfp pilus assembly protein PilF